MAVTHDDVRSIAALARLDVPQDRLEAIAGELNGILRHMESLARVDSNAGIGDDAPGMRLARDHGPSVAMVRPPSAAAPEWRDGFFLVPRLSTHGDAGGSAGDGT